MVVVACLRGVFFVSSLIAACSFGPCSSRKQFLCASRGFCPTGGKHLCGCSHPPYRIGSANFSRRKIGHAHDNSADSENVAGAHEPSVLARFIFRFKNGQGNQRIFLPMTKIHLKRVNHKLSRRTVVAPSTGRAREASNGPEKSLVQHGLVEKKGKFRG